MSYFLTEEVAKKAVDMAEVALRHAHTIHVAKASAVYVVVMDPEKPFAGQKGFSNSVLFHTAVGNPEPLYKQLAFSKARVSWKNQKDSRLVQQGSPHLYYEGDTIFPGGIYYDGIAVGTSGIQSQWDEWFSRIVIANMVALSVTKMREVLEKGGTTFLGESVSKK